MREHSLTCGPSEGLCFQGSLASLRMEDLDGTCNWTGPDSATGALDSGVPFFVHHVPDEWTYSGALERDRPTQGEA